MRKQYNSGFTPEDGLEELIMLSGRVEALGAYLENERFPDRKVMAAMLGIDIQEEEKNGKDYSTNDDSKMDNKSF